MSYDLYDPPRRKTKMVDFDFCFGSGLNWVDFMGDNTVYFIQEYKELIDKGERPVGIRYQTIDGVEDHISEAKLRAKMKDPEPDPKTAPETPEEHRKSW